MKSLVKVFSLGFVMFLFSLSSQALAVQDVTDYGYGGDTVSCNMHANPNTIENGGGTTLIWYSSDNVVSAVLHPKNSSSWMQSVPVKGWWWLSGIIDTRTYTLTVTGENGQTADCDADITVIDNDDSDPICELSANPNSIPYNGGTTLQWTSSDNVVSAYLHPENSTSWTQGVALNGSWWISGIVDTRTYSLTVATSSGRTATCNAHIAVDEPSSEAPTCEISANPNNISYNGGTTLQWTSSDNVVSAKLHPTGSIDYFANVTPSGSWWISGIVDSRSYSVTVKTADGQTATCDVPIVVE